MHSEILRFPRILILVLTVSFPAVLAVLFTPALPSLALYFQISEQVVKISMTTFLLGYASGTLFCGPLANRWGRKNTMFIGFSIAFIATLLSLWMGMAQFFWMFCFARFIQGLGAASGLKVSFTMVADTHSGNAAARVLSYLLFSAILVPGLALGLGGSLTSYFGWESCFVFMASYCLLLLFMICFLPETAKEIDAKALQLHRIVHGYGKQFKDSFLVLHALITGFCASCYFIYVTQGPYVGIDALGLTPQSYGWLSWIPMLGMIGGCVIAAHLAGKQSPRITMISGFLLALVGVLAMLICFANHYVTIASFFVLMAIIQTGIYVISPTALSVALNESTDKSNATAVNSFITIGMSFVSTLILSLFPFRTPMVLPALIGASLLAILAIWLKLKAHHQKLNLP